MARTSSKKEEQKNEIDENIVKSSTEKSAKQTKKVEKIETVQKTENNAESNIEDLKNILQDLKTVLTNLGVNISELEVSLAPEAASSKGKKDAVEEGPKDSDTLLISETQSKVVLPYKIEDIQKILEKNKNYKTIQDVIDGEYTFPIEKYRNSSKSRYVVTSSCGQ